MSIGNSQDNRRGARSQAVAVLPIGAPGRLRKKYDAWEKANNEAFERWRREAQERIAKGALPDEFRPDERPSRYGTSSLPLMDSPCIIAAAIESGAASRQLLAVHLPRR